MSWARAPNLEPEHTKVRLGSAHFAGLTPTCLAKDIPGHLGGNGVFSTILKHKNITYKNYNIYVQSYTFFLVQIESIRSTTLDIINEKNDNAIKYCIQS